MDFCWRVLSFFVLCHFCGSNSSKVTGLGIFSSVNGCRVDLGKHTKLVWLRLPNSHCATKSLVTALQMSDVHFKSQTSTVQCFRFTEIVCTLLFSFYLWRQVEIKISKMIWLRQAARASKTSFLSADKKSNVHSIYSLFQIHNCAVEVNIQCAVN